MEDNEFDPIATREVYIILEKLDMLNEIPSELLAYMQEKQDVTHEFSFNENRPLLEQLDNENTKAMLSYLIEMYRLGDFH